jgi:hypothetical protein
LGQFSKLCVTGIRDINMGLKKAAESGTVYTVNINSFIISHILDEMAPTLKGPLILSEKLEYLFFFLGYFPAIS